MICVIKGLYNHHVFFFLSLHTAQHHDLKWGNWGTERGQVNWLRCSTPPRDSWYPLYSFLPHGLKDQPSAWRHTQAQLCKCSLLESSHSPWGRGRDSAGQTWHLLFCPLPWPSFTIWPSTWNTAVKCAPFFTWFSRGTGFDHYEPSTHFHQVSISQCPLHPFRCCLLKAIIFYFL